MPVLGPVRSLPSSAVIGPVRSLPSPIKTVQRKHSGLKHQTEITFKMFVDTNDQAHIFS
ncbi:hypothetical protein QUA25_01935 [Microcoleus sp. Pol17C6]